MEEFNKKIILTKYTKTLIYNRDVAKDLNIIKCSVCNDEYTSMKTFTKHINRPSLNISFPCILCKKTLNCTNRCQVLLHETYHPNNDFEIDFKNMIIKPLSLNEMREKIGVCDEINEVVDDKLSTMVITSTPLTETIRMGMTETKEVIAPDDICNVCSANFSIQEGSNSLLRQHLQRMDPTVNHFCFCGRLLPNNCSFVMHMNLHKNEYSGWCPECGVHILDPFEFSQHLNDCKHNYRIMILKCISQTCMQSVEERNIKQHFQERHMCEFQICEMCQTEVRDHHLLKHVLMHYKYAKKLEYKYFCDTCEVMYDDEKEHRYCVEKKVTVEVDLNNSDELPVGEKEKVNKTKIKKNKVNDHNKSKKRKILKLDVDNVPSEDSNFIKLKDIATLTKKQNGKEFNMNQSNSSEEGPVNNKKHTSSFEEEDVNIYQCQYCSKKYTEEILFQMHARAHGAEFLCSLK